MAVVKLQGQTKAGGANAISVDVQVGKSKPGYGRVSSITSLGTWAKVRMFPVFDPDTSGNVADAGSTS